MPGLIEQRNYIVFDPKYFIKQKETRRGLYEYYLSWYSRLFDHRGDRRHTVPVPDDPGHRLHRIPDDPGGDPGHRRLLRL